MSQSPAARGPHPANIPDAQSAATAARPWRPAPIDDQLTELRRLQADQRRYHAKVMAVGTNAKPTLYRLSDWRLASAIRTLEALRDGTAHGGSR